MRKLILVLIAASFTFSCSKEGPAGPAGKDGSNGTNGNANVISSNIYTVPPGNWSAFGTGFFVDLNITAITTSNVNNVTVLVYEETITNNYISLPSVNGKLISSVLFEPGMVSILLSNVDGTQVPTPTTNSKYRIIVIPSSAMIGNINYNNFSEVNGYYNLK